MVNHVLTSTIVFCHVPAASNGITWLAMVNHGISWLNKVTIVNHGIQWLTMDIVDHAFILTKIVRSGNNVTFSCPIKQHDNGIIVWYGPPDSRTLYANGTFTNPRLSTIAIVGDHARGEYNLYLSFLTKYDEGHYTCSMKYNDLSTCPSNIQTLKHVRVYTDACLLFVEHELSWDDAHKSCRNLGGDLVTIKDSAKEKFILDSLKLEHWNAANVWIGATDKGSSVTYGHFAKGQGNNHNTGFFFAGGSNEDCALIRRSDGGLWHDYPCHPILGNIGYHYTYACEFPKSGNGTTNGPTIQVGSTDISNLTSTMAPTTTTIETMAPSTSVAPTTTTIETMAPSTSMPNVETPAPTTMANIETPKPTTLPNVETPAPTMPNIETPLPTAPNTVIIGRKRRL
ncbi:unnamed protein product [Mytilus coruscus]|uniref:MRC n=1 Tax=Mytilus coruscus TaxID=42192 RepID=A0A6J8DFH1_MYTCO|nr:unnamed protein product [Mytilus coruscus]